MLKLSNVKVVGQNNKKSTLGGGAVVLLPRRRVKVPVVAFDGFGRRTDPADVRDAVLNLGRLPTGKRQRPTNDRLLGGEPVVNDLVEIADADRGFGFFWPETVTLEQ